MNHLPLPRRCATLTVVLGVLSSAFLGGCRPQTAPASKNRLSWSDLPTLPDPVGFAGPFAGVLPDPTASGGSVLFVAGGANFPERRPWDGGTKIWYDSAFVLRQPSGTWETVSTPLPQKLAYGSSVSVKEGLVCMGGGDATTHSDGVFQVRWDANAVHYSPMPPLPQPNAFSCAAVVGRTIYVAGGRAAPDSPTALRVFWSLDLDAPSPEWKELEPWDGPGRILAVAGSQGDAFYLFSGASLEAGERTFLTDAHRYLPGEGWKRLAAMPRAAVAAPSPAPTIGASHSLLIGGDDGSQAGGDLRDAHPGFPANILAYEGFTDTWRELEEFPKNLGPDPAARPNEGLWPPVTTPTCQWRGRIVVPSGEVRPGVRTPRILAAEVKTSARSFGATNTVVLVLYLTALVAMGVYFSRREKSLNDFFLGGQRVPWWAAGISIFGTQLSAITFMDMPALVYRTNWVYFLGNMMIVAIAPIVVLFYVPTFRKLRITTAYEYLESRFHISVRLAGSLAFLLLQVGRMGIILYLPALALATVTQMDIFLCILVMGVLATIYTVLGGIEAVIWTDVLQVVVLLGGALWSLVICLGGVDGGLQGAIEMGSATGTGPGGYSKFHAFDWSWDATTTAIWVVIVGRIFENLVPYTADQTVVQRYLATADAGKAKRAVWTNAFLTIPGTLIFFAVGTALWAFYKSNPEFLNVSGGTKDVFAWFIGQQLPTGITGLVIAGLFAASMSSLDSSMNSMATVITTDYVRLSRTQKSEAGRLLLARILTLFLGVLGTGAALLLAWIGSRSMWDAYSKIVGLFGSGLAGLFILALFVRRANWQGALCGFVASAVALHFVRASNLHFFLYSAVGITTCVVTGTLASLFFPAQSIEESEVTG